MRIKTLVDEDFVNYKQPSMFIGTISCSGKCCIEAGIPISVCQNDFWRNQPIIEIDDEKLIRRYLNNSITSCIVFGGLEPFEQYDEMYNFIRELRKHTLDLVIIYTGYTESELHSQIMQLREIPNIIIKFGRYIPNSTSRFDDVLGITLASSNQYAERISLWNTPNQNTAFV